MKYVYLILMILGTITVGLTNVVTAGVVIYSWAHGVTLATALWAAFKFYIIAMVLGLSALIIGYLGL